ncbi:mitochondrial fission ELM1 family protein [Candidatus Pelagibacter sp.]|nr:mitochondrial fission ELM1 family protein [Candidatus Pelagibacter sp.]MDC3163794.1 mitochondrial fission ELM1 family protein [Candidatus Pelagibacter sp.]
MTKLKGILLTEGMHGMVSQAEGLAKALDINFSHHTVETKAFWKIIPPKFTPITDRVFKKIDCKNIDIIISCGRKSIIPSIFLKKNSKKKIFTIHIQNPKVKLGNFDLIVVPEHDNLDGDNVLKTKGAIHYLTSEEIENNKEYLFSISRNLKDRNIISLIIGGPTQYYDYSDRNIQEIFSKVNYLVKDNNLSLVVIPSMRTPRGTIEHAKIYFGNDHLVLDNVDKKAYLSALSISKHIVVTCDSSSMISEAALTGKPIYIANIPPKKSDKRFKNFRKLFQEMKIIRELGEKLENWNYEKLDETNRIANIIKDKIQL